MLPLAVEICIHATDARSVRGAVEAAYAGGAARIELCSAMEVDGLTPPLPLIAEARRAFHGRHGLLVMIRPRAGDFHYRHAELEIMQNQIEVAATAGADGVVLGALHQDGRVAVAALRRLVEAAHARGLAVTCHRAFDATPDRAEALRALLELGVDRVLTGGIPWGRAGTALDGLPRVIDTIRQAQGRIEVVLGGGLHAQNVPRLLAQLPEESGPVSIHAYSGARIAGETSYHAVRALVAAAAGGGSA